MTTLTLPIDESTAHKARLAAQRRRITVDVLVQELIERLIVEEQDAGSRACDVLDRSFQQEVSAPFGGKPWNDRDELSDR